MRDPRHDILFEPITIGPVTAPNRFYQVPHCNGMGRMFPNAMIKMRGMKAEGGWGIVTTEQCDFHASGDTQPFTETNMWDDGDKTYLGRMVEAVHEHGSLVGVELVHNGQDTGNLYSREVPIGPEHRPVSWMRHPFQARAMDRQDIRAYRRWHRNAVLRARDCGFDLVVVYAGHDGAMPSHFLARRHNHRSDEYGGSLENRLRLFRELVEDTREAVGDRMGIIVRFAVDEMMGEDGLEWQNEGKEAVEMLAELPDLWDVNVSDWDNDSKTSRFAPEGYQEEYIAFVKKVTTKPVAGVGRYTSPDTMVSAIKRGVLDLIGAARPSIADPFLPRKISEGRSEDIRECIGCNICVAFDNLSAPSRCTQNPTFGEEWRKNWHPESIRPKESDDTVLIVGGGPAGLEAARAAGLRGYEVMLAEATQHWGGRVSRESALPGLAAWSRVRDYRLGQIQQMTNVRLYPASKLSANDIFDTGAKRVAIATGARWRKDGVGYSVREPVAGCEQDHVLSPDDLMDGKRPPDGPVLIFDDDGYYMATVLADLLVAEGFEVTLATPGTVVAQWTEHTLELGAIEERLAENNVKILPRHTLHAVGTGHAQLRDDLNRAEVNLECAGVVVVTARLPIDDLWCDLERQQEKLDENGIQVQRIGDCYGPGPIASAVYMGHRYAQELGTTPDPDAVPFLRERMLIEA